MRKLLFCMLGLAMTACAPRKAGNVNNGSDELAMLVGTYTDGNSKGIYTFRFNQETGLATSLSSIEVLNPSYLIPSEDGKFVYAVSEMNDATAALNAFSFDKETGKLSLLNRQPTMGADPCYVATNGKEVLTANYSGGSMSVFPLKKNGSLEPVDTLFEGSTGGPDTERQATPHVHCTVFSPDGKYIFATDFSADRILRFVIHPKSIIPHPSAEAIDVDPNSGPASTRILSANYPVISPLSATWMANWKRYRPLQPTHFVHVAVPIYISVPTGNTCMPAIA